MVPQSGYIQRYPISGSAKSRSAVCRYRKVGAFLNKILVIALGQGASAVETASAIAFGASVLMAYSAWPHSSFENFPAPAKISQDSWRALTGFAFWFGIIGHTVITL